MAVTLLDLRRHAVARSLLPPTTLIGALRARYPLATGLTIGMAYNGGDANLSAGSTCWPNGGVSRLTATTRCLRNEFRWINHPLTPPDLNFTDYATNVTEISQNLAVAGRLGIIRETEGRPGGREDRSRGTASWRRDRREWEGPGRSRR